MLSTVRKRLCYANVVATLALVFAMSGGALAAGHYLLSSTSQISPKVLKALKGHEGKPGAAGAQGAQGTQGPAGAQGAAGPQGPQGPAGETGPTGPAGAPGAAGAKGATGAQGPAGSPWTADGTLPSGKTETGVWAIGGPGNFSIRVVLASFAIPLAEAPEFNLIKVGEGAGEPKENLPPGCKGNVQKPEANPGNLCVFETVTSNIGKLEALGGASTTGAVALIEVVNSEGEFAATGRWAVTAK